MRTLDFVTELDVSAARAALVTHNDHFADETLRQTIQSSPHYATATIYLRSVAVPSADAFFNDLSVVEWPLATVPAFATLLEAVAGALAHARLARCMIVRLMPGRFVRMHRDAGPYAVATERYHLPINTSHEAWLKVALDKKHVPAGHLMYFNKHRAHCAGNEGLEPRDHLIVDVWREGRRLAL